MLTLSIGGWIAACGSGGGGIPTTDVPKTNFKAELSQVGESLRIHWSVTNTGDHPILAFDRIRPGEGVYDPNARNGAYVTGRSNGTVEIAMRAFPVPKGTEGVVRYDVTTTRLAPGASTGGNLIILLPFQYRPAAPVKEGGAPLPKNPKRAVFCLGVMPANSDLVGRAKDPEHPVLPHNQQVADAQTLLCSDPVQLRS
jgi:hypothetical protein